MKATREKQKRDREEKEWWLGRIRELKSKPQPPDDDRLFEKLNNWSVKSKGENGIEAKKKKSRSYFDKLLPIARNCSTVR